MNRQIIVGLGVTGYSLVRHLRAAGTRDLLVVDTRDEPPMLAAAQRTWPDVEYVCGRASRYISWREAVRVWVSPGVAMDACLLVMPRRLGIPMDSDVGLFLRTVQVPVFGVTGTNGKSTVCSLAAHLARETGVNMLLGGNIGQPALDLLGQPASACLLELSSFQLERLHSECLYMGSVLNLAPDHADRHATFDEYREAKLRIYQGAEISLENRQDASTASRGARVRRSFGLDAPPGELDAGLLDGDWLSLGQERIARARELSLIGRHGCANALAALALAAEAGVDVRAVGAHLASFEGLEHRARLVGVRQGVRWIDDSKATNLAAALATMEGLSAAPNTDALSAGSTEDLSGGLWWILGGDAKGVDLTPLKDALGTHVRGLCVLGKDAERFLDVVGDAAPVMRAGSMHEAVALCAARSQAGDTVLLSPAAASLDMFANYRARGRAFASAMQALDA